MRFHQQHGINDCGPACLAMVVSFYKSFTSIARIRKLCKTDHMGTNLAGLIDASKKLGFVAKAYKTEVKEDILKAKLIFPFIAHIRLNLHGSITDHFVVVKKINKNKVEIWDPDPVNGKHFVKHADFFNIWTGYFLFISPDSTFAPEKTKENTLAKFLPLLLQHKKNIFVTILSSVLLVLFGIIVSFYYKYVIDELIITRAAFSLTTLSLGVLLLTVNQFVVEAVRNFLISQIAYKIDLQLALSYISVVFRLPIAFFDSWRTGEIMSRFSDLSKIKNTLSGFALSLILDVILILATGPLLFSISSLLFSISFLNVLLIGIIIIVFSKYFRKVYIQLRQEEATVNSTLVDIINGAYTIKALTAEQTVLDDYEKKHMQTVWTSWKINKFRIIHTFLTGLINGLSAILIFWAGSSGILNDTFTFGTLLSFNALAVYFSGPLLRLVNIQATLQEAFVAAERVTEILDMEVEQIDDQKLIKPDRLEGEIVFKNVSFRYGTRSKIYNDLSFRIEKGQWVGFVGPSGCGKTTLVKLIMKFYLPEQGAIFMDGHDLYNIDISSLRMRIGYIPQDLYIFSGSISENISFHNSSSPLEDIIKAAEKAGADEFINKLPEKYNTRVNDRGSTLSGGERQRLALARALLNKPDILILDEATSSLDSISEHFVHNTIEKLRGSITTIIIAHRLATVKSCDMIFVMDKGNIVESGNHQELLSKDGLYKTMWEGTVL